MAPKKLPWFRVYVEMFADVKIRRLKVEHRWLWLAVLAAARQSPTPGVLLLTEDEPLTCDDLADHAALPVKTVIAGMGELTKRGLLTFEHGVWTVTKWQDRQFASDDPGPRVAKHRQSTADVTADVTPNDRSSNGGCNAPEAETETEPDTQAAASPTLIAARRACRLIADRNIAARVAKGEEIRNPDALAKKHAGEDLWPTIGATLTALAEQHPDWTPEQLADHKPGGEPSVAALMALRDAERKARSALEPAFEDAAAIAPSGLAAARRAAGVVESSDG